MEHWLPIAAAVFLIGMVLYGHHRGFLRQCVSVGALVLTICLVKIVTPSVTEFIESNPQIHSRAAEIILTISGWNESGKDNIQAPASQRTVIEGLKLPQFIKDMLKGWVLSNLDTMFTDVNDKVGTIAGEVSKTPSSWNSGIFGMVQTLSENVIVPIAGMIISFVLVYELITMVIDKNNMHDFDTSLFFRFLFKACIAVSLLSKTFDIVMAVFDVGSHVVTQAAASISGSTSLDVEATLTSMFNSQIDSVGIGELIGLGMETMIISLCMKIMSVLITVILYGRMIEIYLYVSVAPIPAATVTNREWGTVGTNYLKGLIALAFQGFFIMVCVAIYAVLVASVVVASNLHSALWSVAAYTVILCFSLFKTGSLSKSIFNAH